MDFLHENYEAADGSSMPRSVIYNQYLRYCRCQLGNIMPMNPASFGKLLRLVFTGIKTRRLGTRLLHFHVSGILYLHFNGHFPYGSGLAGTRMSPFWTSLEPRMIEVAVTTVAVRCGKLRSYHHHQPTTTQFFYRLDALPVAHPTVSKDWREYTVD